MRRLRFGIGIFSLPGLLATVLGGCGVLRQPQDYTPLPSAALATPPQRRAIAMHAAGTRSWRMSQATGQDYLYVGGSQGGSIGPRRAVVAVDTYPQFGYLGAWIGNRRTGSTNGLCSDTAGDVFALLESKEIIEFAHGGTRPIERLRDQSGYPGACSVDPTTGNLAIANKTGYGFSKPFPGILLIYRGASGTPTQYSDPNLNIYHVGYDNKSNLFLEGKRRYSPGFGIAELPSGGSSFKDIKLNKALKSAGIVQWDGTYMTVTDSHFIYRFTVNGDSGTVIGSTWLREPHDPCGSYLCLFYFWPAVILGDVIVGTEEVYLPGLGGFYSVGLWHYPKGGRPFQHVATGGAGVITVSSAPN